MSPSNNDDTTRNGKDVSSFESNGSSSGGICPPSAKSLRTINPIRAIVDPIVAGLEGKKHEKEFISLALGDPTVSPSLEPCPLVKSAMMQVLHQEGGGAHHHASYVHASGTPEARKAIAHFHNTTYTQSSSLSSSREITWQDVVIANGCSGALELALTAILDPDSVLLVPRPGFPLYEVIAKSHGAQVQPYPLDPNQQWQCDLEALEQIMTTSTSTAAATIRAMILTNPSNPTGSVYSRQHLQDIVEFCHRHELILVADEVYGDLTFAGHPFTSVADIPASCEIPILVTSGLAKQFLLPGWRVGWIVFYDNKQGSLQRVREGVQRLAQVILGASHLAQSVVPALLMPPSSGDDDDDEKMRHWKSNIRRTLEGQAHAFCRALADNRFVHVLRPQGAMYAMLKIHADDDIIHSDICFVRMLLEEENVFCLPGQAFGCEPKNGDNEIYLRVTFLASEETLQEAAKRIDRFCQRHAHTAADAIHS